MQKGLEQAIDRFGDTVGATSGVKEVHQAGCKGCQSVRGVGPVLKPPCDVIGKRLPLFVDGNQFLLAPPVLGNDTFKGNDVLAVAEMAPEVIAPVA